MDNIEKSKGIPYFMCPNKIFDKELLIFDCKKNIKRDMNSYEKIILIYLLRCCNNGKKAFPSYKTMADKCSMSERQARYSIENLFTSKYVIKKNRGYISERENQVNKTYSNTYSVNMDLIS